MKLTIIEGSRNVGKTYLIAKSNIKSYKFPFVDYFNHFLLNDDFKESNKNLNAYHFSNAFDITLLDMHSKLLANTNILYDRGFLSNIVLGILGERITIDDGKKYIDYLIDKNYISEDIRIIQVTSNFVEDTRNKDNWEVLNFTKSEWLYDKFSQYLLDKYKKIDYIKFYNSKTEYDVITFNELLKK